MRYAGFVLLLTLLCGYGSADAQTAADMPSLIARLATLGEPAAIRDQAIQQMDVFFIEAMKDPQAYADRVRRECGQFPEGDLYPYVLPALAMHHRVIAEEGKTADRYRPAIMSLTRLAVQNVARRMNLTVEQLHKAPTYRGYGCHLSMLNLLLAANEQHLGDQTHRALRQHISGLLRAALDERDGKPINSYPVEVWPLDSSIALVSLKVADDEPHRRQVHQLIDKHLVWLRDAGTDPRTQLPYSQFNLGPGSRKDVPRGCALSWQLAMIGELDAEYATDLYTQYSRRFWLDHGPLVGFSEYPPGVVRANNLDSGPVMLGIGGTASAFGFAVTRSQQDAERHDGLSRMVGLMPALTGMVTTVDGQNRKTIAGLAPADPKCVSGFLYGDMTLYYATTWQSLVPAR